MTIYWFGLAHGQFGDNTEYFVSGGRRVPRFDKKKSNKNVYTYIDIDNRSMEVRLTYWKL